MKGDLLLVHGLLDEFLGETKQRVLEAQHRESFLICRELFLISYKCTVS